MVDKAADKMVDNLSKTERMVLNCIISNPRMSQIEIGNKLLLGKTTIQNAIVRFKKMNLIIRVGSNKTGYWKVTDK